MYSTERPEMRGQRANLEALKPSALAARSDKLSVSVALNVANSFQVYQDRKARLER